MSDPKSALRAVGGSDTSGATDLPNIPSVPATDNSGLANILSAMKNWMEKAAGSGLTGFATKKELVNAGLLVTDSKGNVSGSDGFPILAIPPYPTGLVASGSMTNILVEWNNPFGSYSNHGYTEIWAAESDNYSVAVMVGQSWGFIYSHAVGEDSTRYYWIRFVSLSGVKGPFNSVTGTQGQTSKNPGYLLASLNGQIKDSQLHSELNARINLIDAPATTSGSVASRIKTETDARTTADTALGSRIDTVQATVTSNNSTLSAAVQEEATARANADGTLFAQYTVKVDVNGYVSGWGLASSANNATPTSQFIFKADQFAFGAPGLATVYPFVIQATATTVNGVAVPAGVYIDAAYIKNGTITTAHIGSATIDAARVTGKLTANQINADQLNVTNGTFTGQLIGATGTFSGNLAAASGTFMGELQAATGTFAGSLSAGVLDLAKLVGYTETRSSPGTYYFTIQSEFTSLRYELIGGGGGGGAGHFTEWDWAGGPGGGGGAGEYVTGSIANLPAGQTLVLNVGGGGVRGYHHGESGTAGAPTSISLNGTVLRAADYGRGGECRGVHIPNGNQGPWHAGASGGFGYPSGGSVAGGPWGESEGYGATSLAGGNGGSTKWGSGGTGVWAGWGNHASGFGAGGAGGGSLVGGYNTGHGSQEFNGWYPGGNGVGGRAVLEFYNPNGVVIRAEFQSIVNRINAYGIP